MKLNPISDYGKVSGDAFGDAKNTLLDFLTNLSDLP